MTAAAIAKQAACFCYDDFNSVKIFLLVTWAKATTMTPSQLAAAGKEYKFDTQTESQVQTYLLAKIAGLGSLTPKQLAANAACFCYHPDEQRQQVDTYLLKTIAGL